MAGMPPRKKPRPKPDRELTDLEVRFVEEYLSDPNGTAAYLRIRPSSTYRYARTASSRMMADDNIKLAIARGRKELRKQHRANAERLIRELSNQAFGDPADVLDLTGATPKLRKNLSPAARKLIAGLEFKAVTVIRRGKPTTEYIPKVRFVDSLQAKDKLMRHLGLYKDLPPLEMILAALPGPIREAIRGELAATVHSGADPGSTGGPDASDHGGPGGSPVTDPERPDNSHAAGGPDTGPVAGTHDPAAEQADRGTLYPSVGEDTDGGGEGGGPLFDT